MNEKQADEIIKLLTKIKSNTNACFIAICMTAGFIIARGIN